MPRGVPQHRRTPVERVIALLSTLNAKELKKVQLAAQERDIIARFAQGGSIEQISTETGLDSPAIQRILAVAVRQASPKPDQDLPRPDRGRPGRPGDRPDQELPEVEPPTEIVDPVPPEPTQLPTTISPPVEPTTPTETAGVTH